MKAPRLISIFVILFLAGCVGSQVRHEQTSQAESPADPGLTFESDRFGQSQRIIPVAEIYRLSDEQQTAFLGYFENPLRQDIPAHERVWSYLQDITMEFHYQGETFTAEKALQESSGNCLSLAILTTALAKLAGVETGYQLVDSTPVFESRGNVVYKGQHVRTKLFRADDQVAEGRFLLQRGGLLIDYFPSEGDRFVNNITETQYIAMFYNNLASEAIAREDYNAAFWLLQKSLELNPDNAGSINAMAVVHRRVGELEKAEEIYRYGIENVKDQVSLLRNYRVLLEQQGRLNEVENINRKLSRLDDPSPFDWLRAGHGAYGEGDFKEAVLFYKKAAKKAPYLHESYAGMARAYYKTGNRKGAERELKNALQYSRRVSTRSMYEAKLVALSHSF
jgi:Tfp pilus assembly protein PilF